MGDVPSFQAFQASPLQGFWGTVVFAIAIPEIFSVFSFQDPGEATWQIKEDHVSGDFGFDPLGLKPSDPAELKESSAVVARQRVTLPEQPNLSRLVAAFCRAAVNSLSGQLITLVAGRTWCMNTFNFVQRPSVTICMWTVAHALARLISVSAASVTAPCWWLCQIRSN